MLPLLLFFSTCEEAASLEQGRLHADGERPNAVPAAQSNKSKQIIKRRSMRHFIRAISMLAAFVAAITFSACSSDDYLNEMMVSNYTEYNWHDASIQFMDSKYKYKKKKSIGTVERFDHVFVQIEGEYFFVEFKDDKGAVHVTERYLSNTTASVRTLAE